MQTAIASARGGSAASANSLAKRYIIAWALALVFYFLEYAARSSPAVMIPQLSTAFGATAVGVSAIIGTYYYTYSVTNLVAGVALDRTGGKWVIAIGAFVLAAGCFGFAVSNSVAANLGRLLQGAGLWFRVYRSSVSGHAWILGATVGDCHRCDAMPWYVRRLGRPICRRTDDSSRSAMADDLERSRRGAVCSPACCSLS